MVWEKQEYNKVFYFDNCDTIFAMFTKYLNFRLEQWFLIFSKSGNTFDYMKNLRNTKINNPKNEQKYPA